MIIATFNANSLRSRLHIILDWLGEHQPDVLCVQETKVQDRDFPKEAFCDSGYQYIFRGEKKYNGVAIFSKSPISDVSFGLDDEPKDEARLIKAVINGITIVNTYIPQGYEPESEKFQYKLKWFARLGKYFAKHFKPDEPLIWTGDFNIAREAKDVHDSEGLWGHVCYCGEVQESLDKIMDWGFIDLFRRHCDEAAQYTFWDYRAGAFRQNMGWRLDYIMATKPLAEKCTRCWIDKEPRLAEKPSDHTPVLAEFKV
ncbi:MAG: exodeoxyribonuclease III [Planctomycetota bacterium]|nr:MAG: exodeoxyribonuclease III [Planctomycetota bacterium]